MRALLTVVALFAVCPVAPAQPFEPAPAPGPVEIVSGPAGTPIALEIPEPPRVNEEIEIVTDKRLAVALIPPDGRRITIRNASDEGLEWMRTENERPFGAPESTDRGYSIRITFKKPGVAGRYKLLFTAQSAETPARVQAWFKSRLAEYRSLMRSVPGVQLLGPVPLGASAVLRMDLMHDVEGGFLEVVVPDAAVEVSVTLPDGRVIRQQELAEGIQWETLDNPDGSNSGFGLISGMGLLAPVPGVHHLISMQKALKGAYEIRASGGKAGSELRATFIPVEAAPAVLARIGLGPPAPGEVRVEPRVGCPHECFEGDSADLTVRLVGDIGSEPPAFRVLVENSPWKPVPSGRAIGSPGPVETQPVRFERNKDGEFQGKLTLSRAGMDRVEVQVAGKNAAGRPYTAQGEAWVPVPVNAVVARVVSLSAEGVDTNGDGKYDRLDVTGELEVVTPGVFDFSANVSDAMGRQLPSPNEAWTRQELGVGRHALTVSVPAGKIWNELRDGPLEIRIFSVRREGSDYTVLPGLDQLVRKVEYRRDQWDHGPFYAEDRVSVRGIRPAPSGRFTMAEAEWQAGTPGGWCFGVASLSAVAGEAWLREVRQEQLTPGPHKFTFLFDSAPIAAAGKRDWKLDAEAGCRSREGRAHSPAIAVSLDPDQYELAHGASSIDGPVSLERSEAGSSWSATLHARLASNAPVEWKLTSVPEGVQASFLGVGGFASRVLVAKVTPDTPPGRYFIGVTATSGTETASREFVLDLAERVKPPEPAPNVVRLPAPPAPSRASKKGGEPCPAPTPTPPVPASRVQAPAVVQSAGPSRIRVATDVQAKKLIRRTEAPYPALAKAAGIQGSVVFTAIIATDGKIANLQLVSGHPLLVPGAEAAVKQWVYSPTLLNGRPVEVVTTIQVDFQEVE